MKNQTNIRDKSMDYKHRIKQLLIVGEGQIPYLPRQNIFLAIAFKISNFEWRKKDEILYIYNPMTDQTTDWISEIILWVRSGLH